MENCTAADGFRGCCARATGEVVVNRLNELDIEMIREVPRCLLLHEFYLGRVRCG